MKIVVFAHQTIGCACLEVLRESEQEIVGVVTEKAGPDPSGWFQSVETYAHTHQLPVLIPGNIENPDVVPTIKALQPDIILSFDDPHHLRPELLSLPPRGSINLYNTYLPDYRGCTPHIWAVLHGELKTGVTLHEITPGAEGLIAQESIPITWNDTAHDVYTKQAMAAAELLRRTLPSILSGEAARNPLDLSAGHVFGPIQPETCRIDWHRSGRELYNLVRAVTHPYPGASASFRGEPCTIWKADARPSPLLARLPFPGSVVKLRPLHVITGDGLLIVRRLQLNGGPELDADTFVHRHHVTVGDRFTYVT